MAELANKGVPARLASLILRLADKEGVVTNDGVMIPTRYTHDRLGTMIGAKRVAVSRAFNLLRQVGAVESSQRHMLIKDTEVLKRIASAKETLEVVLGLTVVYDCACTIRALHPALTSLQELQQEVIDSGV